MVIDEFAARFVYFYTGTILARHVFTLTVRAHAQPWFAFGGLALWSLFNGAMVFSGYALLRAQFDRNLSRLLPADGGDAQCFAQNRMVVDIGTMSVIITAVGLLGSLALFWAVRGSWAAFLFERPAQFWLVPKRVTLQPAE